jgi:hypothetical protein
MERARVDAGDHQLVTGAQELQQQIKLSAALAPGAGHLLGSNQFAACSLQGCLLD